MDTHPPAPLVSQMLHSHSDLTRQVEELEALARAVRSAEGDAGDVFDSLLEFAAHFSAEAREHMAEEEDDLFPRCQPYLTASSKAMLHRIRHQHRDLENSLQKLNCYLEEAREYSDAPPRYLIESIYLRCRLLRYAFAVHSDEEREFFAEVFADAGQGRC